MFILDSHKMKSAMFAKSTKTESDIELWHKRIGHINLNKLKAMKSKGVVIGLPNSKRRRLKVYAERANSASNIDTHSRKTGT